MALPYQPQNVTIDQADGNIALTWAASLSATGYTIQRSTDGVNFTTLGTVGQVTSYLDVLPGTGAMYWYQVAGTNSSGTSTYSTAVQMVAAPSSEMSLYELRLRSQQTADRVGSQFVTPTEWNAFLRLAMYELYDLLITSYEDLFASDYVYINTDGTSQRYPIPNGVSNFYNGTYPSISSAGSPAKALYKIAGLDLGVNTSNNAWVTLKRFDFIERNSYIYPNSTSTIYGVYNMRYRFMGDYVNIIPTPSGGQQIRLWYSSKLTSLLQDTDLTTIGYSGWLRYPIVRAAKYALDKEESDTSKHDAELLYLKQRIEQTAQNRDIGQADTISATRQDPIYGGTGFGNGGGGQGGWAILPFWALPGVLGDYIGNGLLVDAMHARQLGLAVTAGCILLAYFINNRARNFRGGIFLADVRDSGATRLATFRNHIGRIFRRRAKEKMIRAHAPPVVAGVAHQHTVGELPVREVPCDAVCGYIASGCVPTDGGNASVPSRADTPRVLPAIARFINVFDKSIDVDIHGHVLADGSERSRRGW